MENFDIDQLERKNIYKTPDDFFNKIQENVMHTTQLNEVETTKPAKIFKLNWMYAVAASVVMILGITLFFQQDEEFKFFSKDAKSSTTKIQQKPESSSMISKTETRTSYENDSQFLEEIPTTRTEEQPSETIAKVKSTQKTEAKIKKTEQQIENMLDAFSAEDIATLSKNTEQDIYLDLYN